jgi:hypothetical protein
VQAQVPAVRSIVRQWGFCESLLKGCRRPYAALTSGGASSSRPIPASTVDVLKAKESDEAPAIMSFVGLSLLAVGSFVPSVPRLRQQPKR